MSVYEKGGYAGFCIGVFEPYVMIDIDHCVTNGESSDMAKEIVELMDSYTEYSLSGMGVHIIAQFEDFKFDSSKYYINNHKIGLEVYVVGATKKYLTMTGNVICDKPPMGRNVELQQLLDTYMKHMEEFRKAQAEIDKGKEGKSVTQKIFKVV